MNWIILIEALYILIILTVVIKIIRDTDDSVKATAYILLVALLPIIGIFVYLSFGLNYRKRSLYSKKLLLGKSQSLEVQKYITAYRLKGDLKLEREFPHFFGLNRLFPHEPLSFATRHNEVKLLFNGEEKFPELLKMIRSARHHIHLEYYIYENDETGNELADALIQKAREGVQVRFIYDDFGSRTIRKTVVPRLRKNGVQAFPFHKITFVYLANRLNYRNHRKIVIIDAETAFVGGINIADKYDNRRQNKLYWRDTHLKIKGEAARSLQDIFFADWNFCSGENLKPDPGFFKIQGNITEEKWVQVVNSGPDSETPDVLYSYLHAIHNARENIFISTPYFIPTKEIISSLKMAAISGLDVRLLVPGISDSFFVNAVSKSYYGELLESGVKVYLYEKGFVHAKTMVCDAQLSFVGTANLDHRSFELNFEVNVAVYNHAIARQLQNQFLEDIQYAREVDPIFWRQRPTSRQFLEKVIRMIGPLM